MVAAKYQTLTKGFTTEGDTVYALKNMPEIVKAAVFARYSRTAKTARELLVDEFLERLPSTPPDAEAHIYTERANNFFKRVLVEYGDDSVAELANAHVAVEGVSCLAADMITDSRAGLSPLEQSTRYVKWPGKIVVPQELPHGPIRTDYLTLAAKLYTVYNVIYAHSRHKLLEEAGVTEAGVTPTLNRAVRAAQCDVVRGLIPAGAQTNIGINANGRAYEHLISKLLSGRTTEMWGLGTRIQSAVSAVLPIMTRRAAESNWLQETIPWHRPSTTAPYYDNTRLAGVPDISRAIQAMYEAQFGVKAWTQDMARDRLHEMLAHRQSRRERPPRSFERMVLSFDIACTYGTYRDLKRHRYVNIERSKLGDMWQWAPLDPIVESPQLRNDHTDIMWDCFEMAQKLPYDVSEYIMPRAGLVSCRMTANLREWFHFCELRSQPAGHPEYRAIAQAVARQIKQATGFDMTFVNYDPDESLSRLAAEQRAQAKLDSLEADLPT